MSATSTAQPTSSSSLLGDSIEIVDEISGDVDKLTLTGTVDGALAAVQALQPSQVVSNIAVFMINPGPFNPTDEVIDGDSWAALVVRHVVPQKDWSSVVLTDIMKIVPTSHNCDTTTLSETTERIYQMIYINDFTVEDEKKASCVPANRNHLAEWLTWDRKEIYGPTVIVAAAVSIDGRVSDCTDKSKDMVSWSDIRDLLQRRERFQTVSISASTEDGANPYTEVAMRQEQLKQIRDASGSADAQKIVRERLILGDKGFHLIAWGDNDRQQPVNKVATRILGERVYGTWSFTQEVWYGAYASLSEELIEIISNICEGPKSEPDVTEDDVKPDERVVSRYVLLRKRILRIRRGCHKCGKLSSTVKRCAGCYRLRYCSTACQSADWAEHQGDCCGTD
jgi:hypothetical protein